MDHRAFTKEDYGLYKEWLSMRKRPVPSLEELPDTGIVVSDEGRDLAIGFVLDQHTNHCVLGFMASDPLGDKRSLAVGHLIDRLLELAKAEGYEMAFMGTNLPGLIERLKGKGFTIMEENITHLGREL